jgi:UDP-glucuronate 4-epimerase
MMRKMLSRWTRAIILLAVFVAVSHWYLSCLFESHVDLPLSFYTDGPPIPSSPSGHHEPMALKSTLRRSSITAQGYPIVRQIFTQPSPHLWSDIPIVTPHTGQKTVLVTGAAGFIGSHVAEALLERGDVVIVVDEMNDYYDVRIKEGNLDLLREKAKKSAQRANKSAEDVLKVYVGDINNGTMMRSIFDQYKPQWICHLAARAGVRPSIDNPLLYAKANFLGTMSMLEYSREYNVTNVVISSSSSVYGESESTYFSEAEDVNKPVSPYAATKRSGELLSFTYHKLYDLKITNLRFFTVYGPRGRPDMAPYKFISQVIRGDVIEQYGDGKTSRDYTYIEDIVDGVLRAIDRPYQYEIINLGKGSGTMLNEFILMVERHVGKRAKIKLMPAQPGDVPFTNADVSKAKMLLGYVPKVSIEEGVRRTVSWFKNSQSDTRTEDMVRTTVSI